MHCRNVSTGGVTLTGLYFLLGGSIWTIMRNATCCKSNDSHMTQQMVVSHMIVT